MYNEKVVQEKFSFEIIVFRIERTIVVHFHYNRKHRQEQRIFLTEIFFFIF